MNRTILINEMIKKRVYSLLLILLFTLCPCFILYMFRNIKGFTNLMGEIKDIVCFKTMNNVFNTHFSSQKHYFITGATEIECKSESISKGRSYQGVIINIASCFFVRSSQYSGNGGVVFINDGSLSMNISHSMFYYCASSSEGGAIYYDSSDSCLKMICANGCCAVSKCHFAHLKTSQMNKVEYLSISCCSHSTVGSYPLRLYKGNHKVDNTNSSMNNAYECSGIYFDTPITFTSTYCTFSNNIASNSICIKFYSNSGTVSSANIVHNNSPSFGVIYVYTGTPKIKYCIIQDNRNKLFHVQSGSFEVSNSMISHSGMSSTGINNSITITKTYHLPFFNSHYCNTDFNLVKQTPFNTVDLSPTRSFDETQRMKYENTIILTYLKPDMIVVLPFILIMEFRN